MYSWKVKSICVVQYLAKADSEELDFVTLLVYSDNAKLLQAQRRSDFIAVPLGHATSLATGIASAYKRAPQTSLS